MTEGSLDSIHLRAGQPESADTRIWIGPGLLEEAGPRLFSASGRFLLVSPPAARAAADAVRRSLGRRLLADISLDDREESKNMQTVLRIADEALSAGLRRDDALVAVGGGVTCDVTGFAAAILLRGVAWNAVPTTTGAMADASIGGKTGVDHAAGKNLLGSFHPPRVVLIDPRAAATLPDRDFRAGLVEAFKAAWIADASLAARAQGAISRILAREEAPLLDLLAGAARVKASIVASDPREAGRRRVLNFGHTLGHALEAAGGYRDLRHGEAVAWGIAAALEISRRRSGLAQADAASIRDVLRRLGPFPEPSRDPASLAPYLQRDKKATTAGVAAVLLEAIGRARVEASVPEAEWLAAAAIMSLT
ncbi:MAG: 3-dehydroquinate synthase family protein [Acidobacteriota bacterium]